MIKFVQKIEKLTLGINYKMNISVRNNITMNKTFNNVNYILESNSVY